jgi:hypothetical protein
MVLFCHGINLEELSRAAGCRADHQFYIARVCCPDRNAWRSAAYGPTHLAALEKIKAGQARGLTLAEIGRETAGTAAKPLPAATAWWEYRPADDVMVMVRADVGPWRQRQIQRALTRLSEALGKESGEEKD